MSPLTEQKAVPAPWTEVYDDAGAKYYFNTETNESSWERPAGSESDVSGGGGSAFRQRGLA